MCPQSTSFEWLPLQFVAHVKTRMVSPIDRSSMRTGACLPSTRQPQWKLGDMRNDHRDRVISAVRGGSRVSSRVGLLLERPSGRNGRYSCSDIHGMSLEKLGQRSRQKVSSQPHRVLAYHLSGMGSLRFSSDDCPEGECENRRQAPRPTLTIVSLRHQTLQVCDTPKERIATSLQAVPGGNVLRFDSSKTAMEIRLPF